VIRRLRDLLRKHEPEHAPLELNALATDVVRLVSGDAALREVALGLDLVPEPAVVRGDRIQLQQVLLNLILNALDAVADCPPDRRHVVVFTTRASAERTVHLGVSDLGPGLRLGLAEQVFEPFYTTKPSGMGMGLSIARSIVAAHGGRIWARDNDAHGATFTIALPLADPPA
jgi:two-component system sensor kinase FixL